ncbi:hypothetical protein AVEN_87166-1 [Araneus ventricosus]|uniref:Uncharacterized protein n=1 Tax=Araneus ventricosus TaxID=182803 RepID=A0A4Y2M2A4_ARAVE|nr:hypothetical protein AVEN_87166-1 [Araneus ventricosus]
MCAVSFIFYTILVSGWLLTCDGFHVESQILHIHDPKDTTASHGEETIQTSANCEYLDLKDVEFLEGGHILIKAYKKMMPPSRSYIMVDNDSICFNRSEELKDKIFESCFKMMLDAEDFEILPNGSVLLKPQAEVLESKTYTFDNGSLLTCYTDEDYEYNPIVTDDKPGHITTVSPVSEHITAASPVPRVTKVENSVSVVAPIAHLITFCIISSLFIRI